MKKGKKEKTKYGTISLPLALIEKVKKRIEGTGMSSVSAYVSFVLRQILSSPEPGELLTRKEEEEVKKRLKTLGY